MQDLVRRIVTPYPEGTWNEPHPDILPSFASRAEEMLKSFESNTWPDDYLMIDYLEMNNTSM